MRALVWYFLLFLSRNGKCTNILFAFDVASPSHKIWNFALAEELARRGFNVTMLGPDMLMHSDKDVPNYHPIYLEGQLENVLGGGFDPKDLGGKSRLGDSIYFLDYVIVTCKSALATKGFQALINYPEDFKFDLIIFDLSCSGCLLPLIGKFNNPPVIAVTAFLLPYYLSTDFGNGLYPAYVPSFIVQYTQDMDFFQRLDHYIWLNIDLFLRKYYLRPNIIQAVREKFGHHADKYSEWENKVSFLLCNLEPSFHFPQPVTPNIIQVGGLHIKEGRDLPKDLQEIVDNSENGVILFAMGTNVRSDKLGEERIKAILKAFEQVNQTILWKFESSLSKYKVPENVIIRKWLPQNDILAHPNTKLFISHAGGLSTLESAYHGVPVLGIPIFADQHQNIALMEWRGVAKKLDFQTLNEKDISGCLTELLEDAKYSNRAKELSRRMRDQPQTPLDRAIFWIEYTMRHNGTNLLDTRARSLSLFVSSSTDVKLSILAIALSSLFIIAKAMTSLKSIIFKNGVKLKSQ